MDHHDGRAGAIARAEVEDVQCCAVDLDRLALCGIEALHATHTGLRDQRKQCERCHDNDWYHAQGPDGLGTASYGATVGAVSPRHERRFRDQDTGKSGGFSRPSCRCLHIAVIGTVAIGRARSHRSCHRPTYPHYPQERRSGAQVMLRDNWRFSMTSRPNEAAIDEIVASCNGDLHGALKALLLVNEQLEAELLQLYAAVALGGPFERGSNALH